MAFSYWYCFFRCGHLATHFITKNGLQYPVCDECGHKDPAEPR